MLVFGGRVMNKTMTIGCILQKTRSQNFKRQQGGQENFKFYSVPKNCLRYSEKTSTAC